MTAPYFQQALEFVASNELNALPIGKTAINGDNLWVNIFDTELKLVKRGKF